MTSNMCETSGSSLVHARTNSTHTPTPARTRVLAARRRASAADSGSNTINMTARWRLSEMERFANFVRVPVYRGERVLNNTNEQAAGATTAALPHDISPESPAAAAPQWPMIERRKADRRQTDRRGKPHVDPLTNDAAGCTCRE